MGLFIFSVGPASIALYDTTYNILEGEEGTYSDVFKNMFKTF